MKKAGGVGEEGPADRARGRSKRPGVQNGLSHTSPFSPALSLLSLDRAKINDKPGEENGSIQKAGKISLALLSG